MLIPSIDIMDGNAVQLIGGREKVIDAGDPRRLAEQFGRLGEIAVIDLDAALGRGSNSDLIAELVQIAPCRVGGGIRSISDAVKWLDAGARKVILGTAAVPEVLEQLPAQRVIAALDAFKDDVVIEGWRKKTGRRVVERMRELSGLVGGFLVTFVEKEGRLQGTALDRVAELIEAADGAALTIAGGISSREEIASLDSQGADAQVGMAIYSGQLSLADAFASPLKSDRADGLWPTVVVDQHGAALGLAWSDSESLAEAIKLGRGVYHSRSRGLWVKGETSGATQELLRIDLDCDRDALRFCVRQNGSGFCHRGSFGCWGAGDGLPALSRRINKLTRRAPSGSYTKRLLEEQGLLEAKLIEEAGELASATGRQEVTREAADLLYFSLVAMARAGVDLAAVEAELNRRSLKVTRRKGDAKERKGPSS
jgi:phosphoribosylformimino-5-aminoimidazole carboxamide ribotide isomerase